MKAGYVLNIMMNSSSVIKIGEKSLVVYKTKLAVVVEPLDKALKFGIRMNGATIKVREKDIILLHPGPCALSDLAEESPEGDIRSVWELLGSEKSSFEDICELAYGAYTPQSARAFYAALLDGLYFYGDPSSVKSKTPEEVAAEEKKRGEKQKEQADRDAFLERFKTKRLVFPDDKKFLQDVEALARGQSDKSRTLKELGRSETPEEAHRVLLDCGAWTLFINPHPTRYGCSLSPAKAFVPPPPSEDRVDLTSLPAFAIDNVWSGDPDDAVSTDGRFLYVHVADPAASVTLDSPADVEARARGATLYLPEGAVRMLSDESLPLFSLGLSEISPAITFKIPIDNGISDYSLENAEIFLSMVKVSRLTYKEAAAQADDPRLAPLFTFASASLQRRESLGAVNIDLPEVHISVKNETVSIESIASSRAADMVKECMLAAGEAAARWALNHRVPFPFVSQEAGDLPSEPLTGLAGSYQKRRCMRQRILSTRPADHFGLGLPVYTQITSPLRRYTDLLAHEQIRRVLRREPPLSEEETLLRLGAGEMAARATTRAERDSCAHWTAVYLSDKKGSEWEGVVVERRGNKSLVLIPALGMETQIVSRSELAPNERITVKFSSIKVQMKEFFFEQ